MNWYPFRDIGGVKNANLDAAVNLEVKDGEARFGFCTTKALSRGHRAAQGRRQGAPREEKIAIDPGQTLHQTGRRAGRHWTEHDVRASLSAGGRELVAYSPIRLEPRADAEAAVTPPPAPKEFKTTRNFISPACASTSSTIRRSTPIRIGRRRSAAIRATLEANTAWAGSTCGARNSPTPSSISGPRSNGSPSSTPRRKTPSRSTISASPSRRRARPTKRSTPSTRPRGARNGVPGVFCPRGNLRRPRRVPGALNYANRSLDANALNVRASRSRRLRCAMRGSQGSAGGDSPGGAPERSARRPADGGTVAGPRTAALQGSRSDIARNIRTTAWSGD